MSVEKTRVCRLCHRVGSVNSVFRESLSFLFMMVSECLLLLYFSVHSTQKFVSAS